MLLGVGGLPYTTSLIATYPKAHHGRSGGCRPRGLVPGDELGVNLFLRHIYLHNAGALKEPISADVARRTVRLASVGWVPYLAAIGLAFVSPHITIAVVTVVAIYCLLLVASS